MGRYITWEDIADRYPIIDKSLLNGTSEVNTAFIQYAETELDAMLAPVFTAPFSSNNTTVRDLSIDLAYCKMGMFKVEERKEFKDEIYDKIKMLKSGDMAMLTDSSDTLLTAGEPAWSTTKDYHPVFGHGDDINFQVDSSLTYAEEQER